MPPRPTQGEILLVEDQPEQLRVLARLLSQNGYTVRPALTGTLAVQAARKSPPDLILLDVMLPDIAGFDVCRQLKQDQVTQDVPVIFISALHEVQHKLEGFEAGGADYITKPFQMPEVLARVELQLALRRMQSQIATKNEQLQQEIEQRRHTEKALRDSEERYKTLFAAMLDGYALHEIILDDQGVPVDYRFLDINPAFTNITGLGRDIIGKTVRETLPNIEPYWIEIYGQVALTGAPAKFENYSAGVGGKWFTVVAFSPKPNQFVTVLQDITQQKTGETRLRESEERLRTLVNASPDIICFKDGRGRWLLANQTHTRLFGLENADYLGKTVDELTGLTEFHHKLLRDCSESDEQAWELGTPLQRDEVIEQPDGAEYTFNVVKVPLFTGDGHRKGLVMLGRDITERKQTEVQLRKLSRAVEQSGTPVVITDVTGTIEFVNPAFVATTGFTADEVIGKNPRILKSNYHPREFYAAMWQTILQGQVWEGEICNKKSDGELYWESVSIAPVKDEAGAITHFIAHKEDITARKNAEAQMHRLNQQLTQRNATLLALHSIGQTLSATLDVNQVYRVMYREVVQKLLNVPHFTLAAYNPDSRLITCRMSIANGEFNDPSAYPPLPLGVGPISETIRTRQPRIENMDEVRVQLEPLGRVVQMGDDQQTKSGAYVPVISKDRPIGVLYVQDYKADAFNQDTLNLLSIIASQLAITLENAELFAQLSEERSLLSRRVAEQTAELQIANAELTRAVRVKDEFMANMSHELRTPLNTILGMAEILKDGVYGTINDNQARSIKLIDESGQHLLSLINDILDLSKIEAGKVTLHYRAVSVPDICQMSLRFIKQQAVKGNIQLTSGINTSLDAIEADERRLKQVLVNLLSNAVKFTPEGGQVGLEVEHDPEQATISFAVWDTGIGIPQKNLERLFKPFVQIDSSLARKHEGTGLGLSLVFRLTDMHGGRIELVTEEGRGSRFVVTLPLQQPDTIYYLAYAKLLEAQKDNPKLFPPRNASKTPTILLVEDVEPQANLLKNYLSELGYFIWLASNGTDAIELAHTLKPDLILIDMQIPVIDGAEAVRHLRNDPDFEHTPIIGLTSLCLPGFRQRGLEVGLTSLIKKPVPLTQLTELIASCLAAEHNKQNRTD